MSKQHRWLHEQLAAWQSAGLIDSAQAEALAARHPLPEAGRAWGQIIFSAIGAVVAGLGIVLFFAYNWEAIPKFAKLALVFGAIAAAHGAGIWAGRRQPHLAEGLHALGTMLFGAGIWLVAQAYHIDEHYPNGLLLWSLGALALAWALPSLAQGLMAALLIGLWAGFEAFEFERGVYWAPVLVALGLLPLAWLMRSRVLMFFALAALYAVLFLSTVPYYEELAVATAYSVGVIYLLAGYALAASAFAEAAVPVRRLGFTLYLIVLYGVSFSDFADVLDDVELRGLGAVAYFALPIFAVAGLAAWVAWRQFSAMEVQARLHVAGALLGTTVMAVLAIVSETKLELIGFVVFNLLFLGHCLLFIQEGCRQGDAKLVSVACVLFAALAMARYVDLFDSLLVRAAVFLALGAGLFWVGNVYARSRRRLKEAAS